MRWTVEEDWFKYKNFQGQALDSKKEIDLKKEDEKYKKFDEVISGFHRIKSIAHPLLSKNMIENFYLMIGQGYALCCEECYDATTLQKEFAEDYILKRNSEVSRKHCMISSTSIFLSLLIVFLFSECLFGNVLTNFNIKALLFGMMGSYVSIWSRFGKLNFSGQCDVSTLHLERLFRMIVGSISALTVVCAFRSGILLSQDLICLDAECSCSHTLTPYFILFVSFVAGFSERLMPTLVEKMTKTMLKEEEGKVR